MVRQISETLAKKIKKQLKLKRMHDICIDLNKAKEMCQECQDSSAWISGHPKVWLFAGYPACIF